MTNETEKSQAPNKPASDGQSPEPSAEAKRALAEAEARRKAVVPVRSPKELNGPKGPEPTRFGDWEKKGIASDF